MQLQYSYILNSLIPLILYKPREKAYVELETGVKVRNKHKEIDLLLIGINGSKEHRIAVEMKCYREIASSGGKRGATDIFMKDLYVDLELLEKYPEQSIADEGVALVMNDLERLINPKNKSAKCWDYDIYNGTKISNIKLTTPVGGNIKTNIHLKLCYNFKWVKNGCFWFSELQGK